jgi:hypothetical protein
MSVGKRDKPDNNCQIPVYWVLGYGIVTIDLNNDKNDRLRKIIAALGTNGTLGAKIFQ